MEYVNVPPPQRFADVPEMVPGVAGLIASAKVFNALFPQVFEARTVTDPLTKSAGTLT